MNNPGVYSLAALSLSTTKMPAILTAITDLDGMSAVSVDCVLQGAAGGSTLNVIIATSFDGKNWRHIARFDFTTGSSAKVANISGLTAKGVAAYADLSVEGVNDGVLGDELAVIIQGTGTYTAGTLSVNASVR